MTTPDSAVYDRVEYFGATLVLGDFGFGGVPHDGVEKLGGKPDPLEQVRVEIVWAGHVPPVHGDELRGGVVVGGRRLVRNEGDVPVVTDRCRH